MPFVPGSEVVVVSLQKKGRVVAADARGRYRVAIGDMVVACRESDLASVSLTRRQARHARESASGTSGPTTSVPPLARTPTPREARALASLDLHGLTIAEALQAVGERVDLAIRAGLDRLEIIHGISGGRLRAAVRGYLAGAEGIGRFEEDARNPGVTWVYF